jgi:cytosine/adenosine deaminase-related metal-dependent hydrolase
LIIICSGPLTHDIGKKERSVKNDKMTLSTTRLYIHATIITVNKTRDVILDGALLVDSDCIAAIGKTSHLMSLAPEQTEIIDCSGRILIPGLINTHAHLSQSIMRGLAEDLPLFNWLCDAVWHLEAAVQGQDGYDSARLTIAEMLKSGTTSFLEAMTSHNAGIENVVRAVDELGIRACIVSIDLELFL